MCLALAQFLVASGLGRSALRCLGGLRGFRANDLRERAARTRLGPGVYGLVVLDGRGLVIPVEVEAGLLEPGADPTDAACLGAAQLAAARLLGERGVSLRRSRSSPVNLFGDSLGLALALSIVSRWADLHPGVPVLVTGALDETGAVHPVEGVREKLVAAHAELAGAPGVVLAPDQEGVAPSQRVGSLREAVSTAFGRVPAGLSPASLSVERLIAGLPAGTVDRAAHQGAVDRLMARVARAGLSSVDEARLKLEAAIQLRHAGHSSEAMALFDQGFQFLARSRRLVGTDAFERYSIERLACLLDDCFDAAQVVEHASALLASDLSLHSEIRARGLRSQALAFLGRHLEATRDREENLQLQEQATEAICAEVPRTLCWLVSSAGAAQNAVVFAESARRLLGSIRQDDVAQSFYAVTSIAKGMVGLGRFGELGAWLEGRTLLLGYRVYPNVRRELFEAPELVGHPQVSLARAYARAARRSGRRDEVARLDARLPRLERPEDLRAWLGTVAKLECALALDDPEPRLNELRALLPVQHAAATRFHQSLLTSRGEQLEAAIDAVWY